MGFSGFENILKKVNDDENQKSSSDIKLESADRIENILEKHVSDTFSIDCCNDDVKEITNRLNGLVLAEEHGTLNNSSFVYGNQQNKNIREKKIGDGHRKRARERFLLNPDGISDYDLLELLLFLIIPRADTKPIARALLAKFKTINGVFNASNNEIAACGTNAQALKYLYTLMRTFLKRMVSGKFDKENVFNNLDDIKKYCETIVGGIDEEEFHIIFLSSNFVILKDEKIGSSGVTDVSFFLRDIVKLAIDTGAKNTILYHNHPNGDITPSANDIDTTKKINDILSTISVAVQDHIIVAGSQCFSFVENGILKI